MANKLKVKMETKKPVVSPDMIAYLEKNPALHKVLQRHADGEKARQQDYHDHVKFVLKLIHNHTHKVKDITDLPQYIQSLNVLSVPAAHKLIADNVVPALQKHLSTLQASHKQVLNDYNNEVNEKFDSVGEELAELKDNLKGFSPEILNSIQDIIDKNATEEAGEEEEFNPDTFRTKLIDELKTQLKGSTKVIQLHTGGGVAAMPLNRIPGNNIDAVNNPLLDGQALIWQAATKEWVNGNAGGGGQSFTPVPESGAFGVAHADNFSRFIVSGASTATFNTDIQPGDEFIFLDTTNTLLTIQLGAGQTMAISPTTVSSAAGTIFANKKYALIHVYAISSTEFTAQSVIGTWGAS